MKKGQAAEIDSDTVRATYQDVLNAPPYKVAEIVDGKLYTHSRPAPLHTLARSGLGSRIGKPFHLGDGGPGGWWIIDEPEIHLSEDIVVPDIVGWRRVRMPEIPTTAYFTLVPDWVCEVLSPSTRKLNLGGKSAVYSREGVRYLWLVDPDNRSLAAYFLCETRWVLNDRLFDDELVSLPPFEAITFNLSDLWPPHAVHRDAPGKERPRKSKSYSEPEFAERSN